MTDLHQLKTLLSQVAYNRSYNALYGLSPIQFLLTKDHDGSAAHHLNQQLPRLPDKVRGGIAFVLSSHYLETGDLQSIRDLFASSDAEIQEGALNGLWGDSNTHAEMGPGIVALAIEGMRHSDAEVRAEAACVIQNQSAWNVDVTPALAPLLQLLQDPSAAVRRSASYAVGNVAKKKYDLAAFLPALIANLRHEDGFVREPSVWALWQLSRRHDIAPAVAALVHLLASTDDYDKLRKSAAGALLHHARKSSLARAEVRQTLAARPLDLRYREIRRLKEQLDAGE